MSFILQRVASDDQLISGPLEKELQDQIFKFPNETIRNSKRLSEIEWKANIFKSLQNICNLILVVCNFMLTKYDSPDEIYFLHSMSTLLACSSVIFYIFEDINEFNVFGNADKKKSKTDYSHRIKQFVLIVFYSIHPNQFAIGSSIEIFGQKYQINELLSIVITLRIFSIVLYLIQMSRFHGLRVQRVLDVFAVKDYMTIGYAIKCIFKRNGILTSFVMLCAGVLIICFIDLNFERAIGNDTDFLTSLYDSITTMTTIGYGDTEHIQVSMRVKQVGIVILGSFISSVLTLTVINYCQLSDQQYKSFVTLKRLNLQHQIEQQKIRIVKQSTLFSNKNRGLGLQFYKELVGPQLEEHKKTLKEYYWCDSLIQFYTKSHRELNYGIKKVAEKQLMIKSLMSFYIQRKTKLEQQLKSTQSIKSPRSLKSSKSNKSRKRVEDSKKIMQFYQMILNDNTY